MPSNTAIAFDFYSPSLALCGTHTQILRFANWLVSHGHRAHIYLNNDGPLTRLLSPDVGLTFPVGTRASSGVRRALSMVDPRGRSCDENIVFTADAQSFMMAMRHRTNIKHPWKLLAGCYHPRCFFLSRWNAAEFIRREWFKRRVDDRSALFMNDQVKRSNQMSLRRDFAHSAIVPLAISDPGRRHSIVERDRIVSIGRLVDWKSYNMYMIDVVRELRDRGHRRLRWDVYGDGPLRTPMLRRIRELGVEDSVSLKGNVRYDECCAALKTAGVFVGVGTSLAEAALTGLPSIVSIAYGDSRTYGDVTHLREYALGEDQGGDRPVETADLIDDILGLNDAQYEALGDACRLHCARFLPDAVCPRFVQAARAAPVWEYSMIHDYLPAAVHDGLNAWDAWTRKVGKRLIRR